MLLRSRTQRFITRYAFECIKSPRRGLLTESIFVTKRDPVIDGKTKRSDHNIYYQAVRKQTYRGFENLQKTPIRGFSDRSDASNKATPPDEDSQSAESEDRKPNKGFAERLDTATKPLVAVLLIIAIVAWLASDSEEDPSKDRPDFSDDYLGLINRLIYNIKKNSSQLLTFDTYDSKILPDPLPYPYSKPLSLFIELDGLLASLKWDKSIGWRIYTRPGMKQMLTGLGRFYEVILYINAPAHLGDPICQSLDPQFFYSTYRLYRDHMIYKNNCYVKDLTKMNRDLSRSIVVDVDPESTQLQKENSIIVDKWEGDGSDALLSELEKFLIELYVLHSLQGENDIREILHQVRSFEAPSIIESWSKYKDNMREEYNKKMEEPKQQKSLLFGRGLIRRNQGRTRNLVDFVEGIARDEREAYIIESQTHLDSIIQAQRKQDELIRQHLEASKSKGLRLWDYLTGEAFPQPTPSEESPNSEKVLS